MFVSANHKFIAFKLEDKKPAGLWVISQEPLCVESVGDGRFIKTHLEYILHHKRRSDHDIVSKMKHDRLRSEFLACRL